MSKKTTILGSICGILLVGTLVVLVLNARSPWMPYVSRSRIPPPVEVRTLGSLSSLRIFQGMGGIFFLLPDGSLWRWGQTDGVNPARAVVPEQVGTNHDWFQAVAANGHCVALRVDGTFWNWGDDFTRQLFSAPPPPPPTIPLPKQVGIEHDWLSVAAGDGHSVALKKDGTVWAKGYTSDGELGNGLSPAETNKAHGDWRIHPPIQCTLVQVGTNHDWRAISAGGGHTLGLRADGTLWMWGRVAAAVFAVPTQVCSETNWVELVGDFALDGRGELWRAATATPNPSAPAAVTCQPFASNCVSGRFAMAVLGFYQIHSDGTLWESEIDLKRVIPGDRSHRVGRRSDWISLCGWGTALGTTRDGTIWTWGSDPGQEGVMPLSVRGNLIANRIEQWLGFSPSKPTAYWITPIQPQPRPLLRVVTTGP